MIVHIDKYSIQTIMNMELNIDDEWSEFLSITDGSPTPNNERAVELPIQSSTECPKASDIYISTKTNIAYLNIPVNLTDMFWKIPVIGYGMPSEGVVKKQMKFNLTTREELEQLQNNLKNYTCVEQNIITSIIQSQNLIYIIEIFFVQEVRWLVVVLLIMEWSMLEEILMIIKDGHHLD